MHRGISLLKQGENRWQSRGAHLLVGVTAGTSAAQALEILEGPKSSLLGPGTRRGGSLQGIDDQREQLVYLCAACQKTCLNRCVYVSPGTTSNAEMLTYMTARPNDC